MSPPELPFTLYPSRKKTVLLLLGAFVFVAGGIVLIHQGEVIGWFTAVFFGFGIPLFAAQLFPGCSYLTVDERGIVFCVLFRKTRVDWCDLADIGVTSIRTRGVTVNKMVGFNFAPEYAKARAGRQVAQALSGFEGALPDTYGLKAEDLALLLTNLKEAMRRPEPNQPVA